MPKPLQSFGVEQILREDGIQEERPGVYTEFGAEDYDEDLEWRDEIDIELGNKELPIFNYKREIVDTIHNNLVTIVVAETGAGKSTQIPQFLVEADDSATVYLTQPRRPAARGVASRIRNEISDVWGLAAAWDMVNYQTAGDTEGPESASIKVVTDGLQMVRELHQHGVTGNDILMIDEAHEWNGNVEVLIPTIKRAVSLNPNLRVVIMSATIDANSLAAHFSDICDGPAPVIEVPGRTHEVAWHEDPESTVNDKVAEIVKSIVGKNGEIPQGYHSILALKEGKREISDDIDNLKKRLPAELLKNVVVFPLHSKLSKTSQDEALRVHDGKLKIVYATDIAQTSLTIEDVVYVVDGGIKKQIEVDHEGTSGLITTLKSQAECKQGAGRAGRVGPGMYFLVRPSINAPFVPFAHRQKYPVPEILRTDISRNMLRLKDIDIDISDFDMYHKASDHIIRLAMKNLQILGAIDSAGEITRVGRDMNDYPLCTSSARMMVESMRYSEPVRDFLARAVAVKEAGGLPRYVRNAGTRWQELSDEDVSDFMLQLDLFLVAESMTMADMTEYNMDIDNFIRAKEIYTKVAKNAGVKESLQRRPTEQEREDILNCIYAGYLTSIYRHIGDGQYMHAYNPDCPTPRELSIRSIVTNRPSLVVGDPYRIGPSINESRGTIHSIENVSVVTAQRLGMIATEHLEWDHEEYVMRQGKVKHRQSQSLFGMDLGIIQEVDVEPSPRLREQIIHYALENPGDAQTALRQIKEKIEHLAHLSKHKLRMITHDQIIELVQECAPPEITNPAEIEDNLRMILLDPDRHLSLDDFVSPEQRREIRENAPAQIEANGVLLHMRYRNSTPIVSRYNAEAVMNLTDEVYLPDGRHVLFSLPGDSKKYTLYELQAKLSEDA